MLQYTPAANETEHECFSGFESSEPPSTLRMGLLLYAKGVTNRWQHRRAKMEKVLQLVQLPVQCIIPNPDGRGQRH